MRDLVVVAYDMTESEPYFFKRWPALEDEAANHRSSRPGWRRPPRPTYFPSKEVDDHALVDGGVFAANPALAAVVEALKRRSDEPHHLSTDDLLVLSVGTGQHEDHFSQGEVSGWGKLGWVFPHDGDPPILATVLGGASDGVDHWTHTLLNEPPPPHVTNEEIGRGPRFFRMQVDLEPTIQMDDPSKTTLEALKQAAGKLVAERETELADIAERLLRAGPIPPDPPQPSL